VELHAAWHGERELLGAAQLACEREVWDRCINTSDRTKGLKSTWRSVFRCPFATRSLPQARALGLEPGTAVRPDPAGVAFHQRRTLGRRRVRA
jgi:hypothetical protein